MLSQAPISVGLGYPGDDAHALQSVYDTCLCVYGLFRMPVRDLIPGFVPDAWPHRLDDSTLEKVSNAWPPPSSAAGTRAKTATCCAGPLNIHCRRPDMPIGRDDMRCPPPGVLA
ncbi:hypothetical protein [uncultured Thiohalocapsa sp.]|uniref:hypothetical protein n=1 Tax=uncultured Thiohalocapsa sp. TaxID=768990 RepID=UPI0025DBAECB|nr:hypothetical protein [uncultured Thiohalocapsa sp.]